MGFEPKLWTAADVLHNNMDAAEDKHFVLGLIFLKDISNAFQANDAERETQRAEVADPEVPDEVPRWQHSLGGYRGALAESARHYPQPKVGTLIELHNHEDRRPGSGWRSSITAMNACIPARVLGRH